MMDLRFVRRATDQRPLLPLAVLLLLNAVPTGCQTREQLPVRHEFRQRLMGVEARVVLYAHREDEARAAARDAFGEIARLEGMMSDYVSDSEIMKLMRKEPGVAHQVSAELAEVLFVAQRLSRQTDGRFDVTVGPLVGLWRQARRDGVFPDSQELADAQSRVGWDLLTCRGETIAFDNPRMQLDLGGIAKGYAAQRAADLLVNRNLHRCMVSIAGDIVVADPPPNEDGWAIVIDTGNADQPTGRLLLANGAVSTSGDTAQYVEIDGMRYSHIVDPKTGLGLTNRTAATVIAPDGMTADSLASALCLVGIDEAAELMARYPQCAAIIEEVDDDRVVTRIIDPLGILDRMDSLTEAD